MDYVAIYNVIGGIPRLSKTYCGVGIPPPITSTASEVLVRFHSDSFLDNTGFNATFQTLCKYNFIYTFPFAALLYCFFIGINLKLSDVVYFYELPGMNTAV